LLLAGKPLLELLQYDWDLKPLLPLDLEGSGGGFFHRDLPVFELLKQSGFFTWDFFICQSLNIKQQICHVLAISMSVAWSAFGAKR
jgi:hypothetical protein